MADSGHLRLVRVGEVAGMLAARSHPDILRRRDRGRGGVSSTLVVEERGEAGSHRNPGLVEERSSLPRVWPMWSEAP